MPAREAQRLIAKLEAWRHPVTGKPIVEKAYRREEVYSGPWLEEAPDVVVKWGLNEGYNYAFKLSAKSPDLAWIRQVDPQQPENMQFFTGKSGHHRDDGIFLGCGPFIRAGAEITGARIVDLAPTILHLLDVPIPDDMDGRVLEDIFATDYDRQIAVGTSTAPAFSAATADAAYSEEDEAIIAERLKSLGYIE